jgi:hypothetical protein
MNQPNVSFLYLFPDGHGKSRQIVGVDYIRPFDVQDATNPLCRLCVPYIPEMPPPLFSVPPLRGFVKGPIQVIHRQPVHPNTVLFLDDFRTLWMQRDHRHLIAAFCKRIDEKLCGLFRASDLNRRIEHIYGQYPQPRLQQNTHHLYNWTVFPILPSNPSRIPRLM